MRLTKPQFLELLMGRGVGQLDHDGDLSLLARLAAVLDDPTPDFPIVTP